MAKSQKTSVGRRGFLKNAAAGAAGAAALVTTTPLVEAQSAKRREITRLIGTPGGRAGSDAGAA